MVIAPITRGGGIMPGVERQIAELGDGVRAAVLVAPDPRGWRQVVGSSMGNLLGPARRAPAAELSSIVHSPVTSRPRRVGFAIRLSMSISRACGIREADKRSAAEPAEPNVCLPAASRSTKA
ncbi:hypothetical protein AB0L65_21395 [Nonomuraea sp. NPDC052116]|uniref:hypothetical protein n=1 Tax=Nonomuraea sp. NPDC052116 TaxID=3155665 RepID=UPI00343AD6E4